LGVVEPVKQHVNLFGDYTASSQSYDEVFSAAGTMHPHWQRFADAAAHISSDEFSRRWLQAQRLLRQNSLAYPDPTDPHARKHPWALDAFPLTIGADEWRKLSEALTQRAVVLDLVLRDLFGPQRLLREGILPPEVVFRHPGFLLPYGSPEKQRERMLHLYATDLARSPDGQWWVMGDRTEAPSGAGFALENRIAMSRMMPDVIHHCRIERHAPYFKAMQRHMASLAPQQDTEPRIVLLSRTAGNANYFEDAFLARYLGYTLAEAGDLDVRDNQVFIKTLAGLSRVDVLWRRPNSEHCDPLELSSVSPSGVAGLMQAVRSGNVALANSLGSGMVESPIFMAFMPQLCQFLLGEPLAMPGIATYWCGDEKLRRHVLANLDKLVIKPAYRRRGFTRTESQSFANLSRRDIGLHIEKDPGNFVAQEIVVRSTAPVWSEITSERAFIALRTFAVADNDSYQIMPGGLTRLSATLAPLELSLLDGEGSKDTWVLADGPVSQETLLQTPNEPVEIRRGGVDLSSRAAEHFFWLGRLMTRTESLGKWVRAVASRLSSEADSESIPELPILIRGLAAQGMIEPGVVVDEIRDQLPTIESLLPAAVFNNDDINAIRSTVSRMAVLASSVRDLMSLDTWRIIRQMDENFWSSPKSDGLLDVMEKVNELLVQLAALGGNVADSMTRTHAWRFLDFGRRLENAMQTANLLSSVLNATGSADHALLESLLEICDSLMTYRFRYSSRMQLAPVLDLLLCDDTNPRSVLYQVKQCFEHVNQLPRDRTAPHIRSELTLVASVSTLLKSVDSQQIAAAYNDKNPKPLKELLQFIEDTLPKLSDAIAHRYFFHSGPVMQLAKINPAAAM
jgi:uncharacterized circularly permuted ATP-grasp superfamily protein/uncharacterized alpha-E superfamily protein